MLFKKLFSCVLTAAMVIPMFAVNVFAAAPVVVSVPIDEGHFPNERFRNYVQTTYDTNDDMVLSVSEIRNAQVLHIIHNSPEEINYDGIQYLTCLQKIDLYGTSSTTSFDFSFCPNLNYLSLSNDRNVDTINISNNTMLEYVSISDCAVEYLNLSRLSKLNTFYLVRCHSIEEIDLSNHTLLTQATLVNDDALTNLDLSSCTRLSKLFAYDNDSLETISLTNCNELTDIRAYNNALSTIDLSYSSKLTYIDVSDNYLTDINLNNDHSLLKKLYVQENLLDSINISTCNIIINLVNIPNSLLSSSSSYNKYENVIDYYSIHLYCDFEIELITDNPIITRPTDTPTPAVTTTTRPTVTTAPTTRPTVTTAPTARPTVTTVPTSTPIATPTTRPTVVPTTPATDETGVDGFVERLYTIALDRNSDPAGRQDWVVKVYREGFTGADVARGFLYSPEFLGKNMSNQEFLSVLYRVFFDRPGDQGGVNYWLEQMANGMDKQSVIMGFINSTEWANVCLRFGIESGGTGVPNIQVEPSQGIIDFSTRLYTTCLGRNADQNGLMDWARQLANRQISGSQAAAGFFTSGEFVAANYSNEEYINRLYRTFMGREADQGGFDYWMGQFAQGASREDVFNGFAGSAEWAEICSSYGIMK